MLRSTDWFVAAGQVDGGTGNLAGGRGARSVRLGVGHYELTLDQAVDETEAVLMLTVHEPGGLVGVITGHEVSDTVREVHTFVGGIATDRDFDFLIIRFAP